MSDQISNAIAEIGAAIDEFKQTHTARLDEIEKRMNRPRLGGDGPPGSDAETRGALDAGIKALIAGNQNQADQHFRTVQTKSMAVGANVDGGYLVVPEFSTEMTRIMLEVAPFIRLPRSIELGASDAFEEPLDKDSAGASWVGESESRNDTSTPQLGFLRIPVHEMCAQPKLTQKLIDTARVDVVAWLQSKVAEKFAQLEATAFHSGDGVAKPRGFLSYSTAATGDATRAWGVLEHVVTGNASGFKAAGSDPADCLIDVVSKLKPQYRTGAVWLMNRQTEAAVRKLKDSQGRFLLVDSLIAGQPKQLLGYPVVEDEQMPDLGSGTLPIAFGNFAKGYTIVRRLGVRLLNDPFTDKPNVKLFTYARVGGDVANFEAIKLVKCST